MHYNPKFDFEEGIQEHTNNVTFILDLFNADAGFEIYNPAKTFFMHFPAKKFHYLNVSKHFLPIYTSII